MKLSNRTRRWIGALFVVGGLVNPFIDRGVINDICSTSAVISGLIDLLGTRPDDEEERPPATTRRQKILRYFGLF